MNVEKSKERTLPSLDWLDEAAKIGDETVTNEATGNPQNAERALELAYSVIGEDMAAAMRAVQDDFATESNALKRMRDGIKYSGS